MEVYEQRLMALEESKSKAEELEQMQELIERQNRALRMQEESLTELQGRNEEL